MKIIYKNKTSDEIYNNNIEKVNEIIEKYSRCLDFDLNLKVYFQKEIKEVKQAAAEIKKKDDKWFILYIYENAFSYEQDCIDTILFHEFAHIFDIYHASRNDGFKYINDQLYLKSNENLNKHTGFLFWTEVFAYYKCFENNFLDVSDEDSFSKLVKKYEKIVKKSKEMEELLLRGNVGKNILSEHLNGIVLLFNELKYCLARYISSIPFRKKLYAYCQKSKNKKEFKELMKITNELIKLVHKMTSGTYGKYLGGRLSKIGTYINEKMLKKFNLEVYIYHGKIRYEFICIRELEESEG